MSRELSPEELRALEAKAAALAADDDEVPANLPGAAWTQTVMLLERGWAEWRLATMPPEAHDSIRRAQATGQLNRLQRLCCSEIYPAGGPEGGHAPSLARLNNWLGFSPGRVRDHPERFGEMAASAYEFARNLGVCGLTSDVMGMVWIDQVASLAGQPMDWTAIDPGEWDMAGRQSAAGGGHRRMARCLQEAFDAGGARPDGADHPGVSRLRDLDLAPEL